MADALLTESLASYLLAAGSSDVPSVRMGREAFTYLDHASRSASAARSATTDPAVAALATAVEALAQGLSILHGGGLPEG